MNESYSNILIIHFGQLGDVLLGLPALRAIRQKFKNSQLTIMSGRSTAEIIQIAEVCDAQIVVDRVKLRDGRRVTSIAEIGSIVRDVRRRRFDLVIDLHSLPETNILAWLSGARARLLARRGNRSLDFLARFPTAPPTFDRSRHLTDQYLDVLKPLGIDDTSRVGELRPPKAAIDFVTERFPDIAGRAALFPGAGHPSRCWPLERFSQLAHCITAPVVFLGPEEAALRERIEREFPSETLIVDRLSIVQFMAAVAAVKCLITNDTGPLHIAAAVGTEIVLLLDERAPTNYLPISPNVTIISGSRIDQIPVQAVLDAVRSRFDRTL